MVNNGFTLKNLWCFMKLVLARKNCLLLRDDGTIVYSFSKFLTDRFDNPHTRELVAQSLRVFYRFCCANKIELTQLSMDGRCLSYEHTRQLAGLCFRPLPEIEALSDKKVVLLTSAKAGKAPHALPNAVEPNTADKRLNHISLYLQFFHEVFLEPNILSSILRVQLRQEYEKIVNQLRRTIRGTKQGHHLNIKSLPSDKFWRSSGRYSRSPKNCSSAKPARCRAQSCATEPWCYWRVKDYVQVPSATLPAWISGLIQITSLSRITVLGG